MPRAADPVEKYAKAVIAGRIVAGPYVRLACKRHLRDLKERKKTGLVWNLERAQTAIDFFSVMLPLEDGRPFQLQPFQEFIVGSLFGWYGPEGFRRFRTAYNEIGKGNGKSPMAAGIGIYGLVADGEPAAEVYSAATTQDQAKIVWTDAKRMVESAPELADLIDVQVGSLTIAKTHSVFRPVSSEHRGLDGKRVHVGLIDELHEHATAMVVDKIRAGTKARRNALIFEITNSGFDRTSVCWAHHEYSVRVLEGSVENDAWFAYVCALDQGDDYRDQKVWLKANPGLGTILPSRYLEEQVAEAAGMPSKQNIVRRLNFCEWTEQSERAIDMEMWDACNGAVDEAALRGASCMVGLDAGSTSDLSAEALLFGPDDSGVYDLVVRFWIPEESIDAASRLHAEEYRLKLRQWADEGWIKLTPGNVTDYDFIEAQVLKDAEKFAVREVAFDRWGISQLTTHLVEKLGEDRVIGVGQGFASMSTPTKELLKLIASRKIRHGGNPVMRWMASNLALEQDAAGNMKPDKKRSAEKIDGPVATITALARSIVSLGNEGSIYDQREMVVL